mmetsp:Transcript_15786/g.40393  ORF Transcript_15786/g.40393 Transcript_15786/m.40393 type:complete len:102 (+) Transcript_15786:48-353(+)
MAQLLNRIVLIVGLLVLLHAGFSVHQYRSYMRSLQMPHHGIPTDLVIETCVGLLVCTWALGWSYGKFVYKGSAPLPVCEWNATEESSANFAVFNHRARLMR